MYVYTSFIHVFKYFHNFDINKYCDILESVGLDRWGKEQMGLPNGTLFEEKSFVKTPFSVSIPC